jgi:phosphohistidine phosphatase
MELYLLRHGAAVERGTVGYEVDDLRPLVPKGRKQIHFAALALKKMEVRFDVILASPLVRTRETAELLAKELKLSCRLEYADELKPETPPAKLIRRLVRLKHSPQRVLCVGHEPDLGEFAAWVLTGLASARFPLKKGGLIRLDIAQPRSGQCAFLTWALTPPQLKLLVQK